MIPFRSNPPVPAYGPAPMAPAGWSGHPFAATAPGYAPLPAPAQAAPPPMWSGGRPGAMPVAAPMGWGGGFGYPVQQAPLGYQALPPSGPPAAPLWRAAPQAAPPTGAGSGNPPFPIPQGAPVMAPPGYQGLPPMQFGAGGLPLPPPFPGSSNSSGMPLVQVPPQLTMSRLNPGGSTGNGPRSLPGYGTGLAPIAPVPLPSMPAPAPGLRQGLPPQGAQYPPPPEPAAVRTGAPESKP